MNKKATQILLLLVNIICSYLMLVSSNDPIIPILDRYGLNGIFVNGLSGNTVVFNLTTGIIVSTIFYLIVVVIPDRQKANDIRPRVELKISNIRKYSEAMIDFILMESGCGKTRHEISKNEFRDCCSAFNPNVRVYNFSLGEYGSLVGNKRGFILGTALNIIKLNAEDILNYIPYVNTSIIADVNFMLKDDLNRKIDILLRMEDADNKVECVGFWVDTIYNIYEKSGELGA